METERVPTCPVCLDPRRALLHADLVDRLYGVPGEWQLQRCLGCDAAYLDPRPDEASIARAYEAYHTHEPPPPAGKTRRLRKALRNGYLNARYGYALRPASPLGRLVVPLFPTRRAAADRHVRGLRRPREGARVLDVGCGNGEFLREMRAAGWIGLGVETDPQAVARARLHGLDVREGSVEEAAFEPGSVDAVTLSHVVEHLHDPVATLRACRGLLRGGGVLWIATPNLSSPGHARYGRAWRGLEPPRHLVLFGPGALAQAVERAGFRAVVFLRPASARWAYEASAELAPSPSQSVLAVALADWRSARRPTSGEELVAMARPAP